MNNSRVSQIVNTIKQKQRFALITHVNPDGDALGSTFAMRAFLLGENKEVDVYADGSLSPLLKEIPNVELLNQHNIQGKYDCVICLDCSDSNRLGRNYAVFAKCPSKIVIDHHETHPNFGDIEWVDSRAAATAEMVFDLISEYDEKAITSEIAELLYIGLATDTGIFAFSNVTEHTFLVSARLKSLGVNMSDINYRYYYRTPLVKFNLKQRVIGKVKFFTEGKVAFLIFTQEDFAATGTDPSYTEGLINEVRYVDNVQIAIGMTEVKPFDYKVSIRTKDGINATHITNFYGGGGHKNAAGMRINGQLDDIIESLLKRANDLL